MWFRTPICRVPPAKMVKVFVVQVPVRGNLILPWIKKQLQWKESENLERDEVGYSLPCNEIDSLLTNENNLEAVKVKLTEITSLFQRFTDAHEEYNR